MTEPKQETLTEKEEGVNGESVVNDALDQHFGKEGEEKPSESSTEKDSKQKESQESEDAGADQQEKASQKDEGEESEKEGDLSKEEKSELFRKGYNEAKEKYSKRAEEAQNQIIEGLRNQINELKSEMKAKGEEKLVDDVSLVAKSLNIDLKNIDDGTKATISDIAKIARIIAEDTSAKTLPKELEPFKEQYKKIGDDFASKDAMNKMQEIIKNEKILDFEKDIIPELDKFMEDNETAKIEDVVNEFHKINHKLSIERLQLKNNKEKREESKKDLRTNKEGAPKKPGEVKPWNEGKSDSDNIDDILDAHGF